MKNSPWLRQKPRNDKDIRGSVGGTIPSSVAKVGKKKERSGSILVHLYMNKHKKIMRCMWKRESINKIATSTTHFFKSKSAIKKPVKLKFVHNLFN